MALDFDGVDDYIEIGSDRSGFLGATGSVTFWFNTTQVATGGAAFWASPGFIGVESSGDGNDIFWGILNTLGELVFHVGDNPAVANAGVQNDGTWHHAALTRDSTTGAIEIYIDGVLVQSNTSDTGAKTTAFSSIARIEDTGGTPEEYDGLIEDIRLYDVVLTAEEIATMYAARGVDGIVRGLRNRYMFDEGAVGVAAGGAGQQKDLGGDQLNATPTSAPVYAEGVIRSRRKLA